MKMLIIGGTGTIGKSLVNFFSQSHSVIVAGRTTGDMQLNIEDNDSMLKALKKLGKIDAIVNASGEAKWAPFEELTEEDYHVGLRSKLMGQVNLVRVGRDFLKKNGSITLTTGILADDPVAMTSSAAMVNGALHSFVRAAALEINDFRLNVVSCGLVEDAIDRYQAFFPGHTAVSMDRVDKAYDRSVSGLGHGEIIRAY